MYAAGRDIMAVLKDWLEDIEYSVLTGDTSETVSDVIYDSRKAAPGTVFLCMKGSVTDSHDFIVQVYEKGCRSFVVEKELDELALPQGADDINIIKTADSRKALAYLSAARFGKPAEKLKLIGITGTKGKTTTSYMLKNMLEYCGRKVGVIGTNGCEINGMHIPTKNTTPESYELNERFAMMADAGCEFAVMECSSQGFKMSRTDGLTFEYGLFLNLSNDHIGPLEHADFAEYLFCKSRLLLQSKHMIMNADDEHMAEVIRQAGKDPADLRGSGIYTFGIDSAADLTASGFSFVKADSYIGIDFRTSGLCEAAFTLSMPGLFNVSNALSVIETGALLGLPLDKVAESFKHIHVNGRNEVVCKTENFAVIVDYAHNEVSMRTLLATLREYEHKRLVVVFGCGGNRSKDRRTSMGAAAADAADFSVFTADNSRYEKTEDIINDIKEAYFAAGGRAENCVEIPDRRSAIRYAMENARKDDIIAVIGKGHEDYQEENGVRRHFLDSEVILEIKKELGL